MFLLDLAERHGAIAGVVGWVDLCSPNLPERFEFFASFEKLCGFRHIVQAEPDDRFIVSETFLRGMRSLSESRFTFDILIYPKQLPVAIELVERFPDQRFVIDHMTKPPIRTGENASWIRHMRTVAGAPNVFCKISGLITEADWEAWRAENITPYLEVVFEAFGADRLRFGSDWPICLLAGSYGQVQGLVSDYVKDCPDGMKKKIFGLNAARFYNLKGIFDGPAAGE